VARRVTEAILLRLVDFGESDRIVHLLTPDSGRLTAVAKGARRSVKRFSGTLDLFHHLRVHVDPGRRGGMARLEQATLLDPLLGLRTSPARFALGCYLLELLDRLSPESGTPRELRGLFDFALRALRAVQAATPDLRLRVLLELKTLAALGLTPELGVCVRCGSEPTGPGPVAFHVAEGGVVCGACSVRIDDPLPLHLGTLRMLRQALRFEPEQLGRLRVGPDAVAEAERAIARFHRFHLGLHLRSERFLSEILGGPGALPPSV
jgi:DNA repair protein RecO (recombination protein O)